MADDDKEQEGVNMATIGGFVVLTVIVFMIGVKTVRAFGSSISNLQTDTEASWKAQENAEQQRILEEKNKAAGASV